MFNTILQKQILTRFPIYLNYALLIICFICFYSFITYFMYSILKYDNHFLTTYYEYLFSTLTTWLRSKVLKYNQDILYEKQTLNIVYQPVLLIEWMVLHVRFLLLFLFLPAAHS